ncbi:tryptophan synthase subunit alpha [Demequina pelophila]|uniref:tryptophan synthase subunit alpha n=1 Tax=Demequina pelophila TaxID=1638984 RepID=UPI0007823E9D|nr:tryptophan synthase subunit alpha [Demequina pelophila]
MSLVTARLDEAAAAGRAALIGYLPVGYPDVETSARAMVAMVEEGCDLIEVGMPYSDPVLDGPTIQQAAEAALRGGVRVSDVFTAVRAVADAGAPAVVMSYYNPMLQYGLERFAADLAAAGGAGVILPDLTPEVAGDWLAAAKAHGLDSIFLTALSSTPERLHITAAASSGFVYAASIMGTTGGTPVSDAAERLVADTRAAGAARVCVGLGITTGEQARKVGAYADGVIVGSAFVRQLLDHEGEAGIEALRAKTRELASGVRSAR